MAGVEKPGTLDPRGRSLGPLLQRDSPINWDNDLDAF